jgi:parvulin-like peptidyl-prolyl isomerase
MKLPLKIFYSCTILIAVVLIADQVGAFSVLELLGIKEKQEQESEVAASDEQNWAKPGNSGNEATIEFSDMEKIFANLTPQQRTNYLDNDEIFSNFILQETMGRSLLLAARSNKLDQNENVQFLMGRAADNILRESYINLLTQEKLTSQRPTEQQLVDYYDQNTEKFVLPERVQLWQIFFPISEEMNESSIAELTAKAEQVSADVKGGKISFTQAALDYSEHPASRDNGGNMGLINVSDILPDIKESVLGTEENEVTKPLLTDTGIHIIRRGPLIASQDISYEQIKGQLGESVNKQLNAQFRQAIFEQALKTYPVPTDEKKLEEWRIRLRTGLQTN